MNNILDIPVLSVLIPSGGLGFISFILFNKMGKINVYDNQSKIYYSVLFSLVNFIILLSVALLMSIWVNIEISLLLSLVVTLIIATTYPFLVPLYIINKINYHVNNSRTESGLAYQHAEPVREIIFNNPKPTVVYIFDFERNLINCGYVTNINTSNNEPFEMIIEPFDEEPSLKSFEDIVEWSQTPDVRHRVLVNLSEKIQIYFIEM